MSVQEVFLPEKKGETTEQSLVGGINSYGAWVDLRGNFTDEKKVGERKEELNKMTKGGETLIYDVTIKLRERVKNE